MMRCGDLRVKFASFGKLPRMKKPIGRIISDWLGYGVACPEKLPGATSMGCGEFFDLSYDAVYLVDEIGVIAMLSECGNKGPVVPERAVLLTAKTSENFQPMSS